MRDSLQLSFFQALFNGEEVHLGKKKTFVSRMTKNNETRFV